MKILVLALLLIPNFIDTLDQNELDPVLVHVKSDGPAEMIHAASGEVFKAEAFLRNPRPSEGEPSGYSVFNLVPGVYVVRGKKYVPGIGEACQIEEQVVEIVDEYTEIETTAICWED